MPLHISGTSTSSAAAVVAAVALLLAAAGPVSGQGVTLGGGGSTDDGPVLVTADDLAFDDALDIVVARGGVELIQGERILLADTVTLNRRTDIVTASGNVVYTDDSGDVWFAEYAELDEDFANGFVEGVATRFDDNALMAAASGQRRQGRFTDVERVVYSPCELCEDNPDRPPLWQLRAASAVHDDEEQEIVYRDATLEMFGVPLFFTPYLSQPDPRVRQRTGWLAPILRRNDQAGSMIDLRYYWAIAQDRDLTTRVIVSQERQQAYGGDVRQRFESGFIDIEGTVNFSEREDKSGEGDTFRGHLFADTQFAIDEHWRAGASIRTAMDDNYLEVFEISDEDILDNRVYLEGFTRNDYAVAEALAFIDVRPNRVDQPYALPHLSYAYTGLPGSGPMGGTLFGSADGIVLTRPGDGPTTARRAGASLEGIDTARTNVTVGWRHQHIARSGVVAEFESTLAGSAWRSQAFPDPDDPSVLRDGVTAGRLAPLAQTQVRYPFVGNVSGLQAMVQPVLSATASLGFGSDEEDIPNNDSLGVEFDELTLLAANRFPGFDRREDGVWITYGGDVGLFDPVGGGYASAFVGQSYRLTGDDELFPAGSGLDQDYSDIVGVIDVVPARWLDVNWRFRLDSEDLSIRRNEIDARAGVSLLSARAQYTFVDDQAGTASNQDEEELKLTFRSRFTQNWSASAGWTVDLDQEENREASIGISYVDECFTFRVTATRDFTDRESGINGDSFLFYVAFRGLGEFPATIEGSQILEALR